MLQNRKIFYFTTHDKTIQGDYQEVQTLIGLRQVLGNRVIDWPRKKVLYGEFEDSPRQQLHGRGFTLYTYPIEDIENRSLDITENDIILYGVTNAYGITKFKEINKKTPHIFYIDGHDYPNIQGDYLPSFKREMFHPEMNVYPFGFSIPYQQIRYPNLSIKSQLYAKSAPPYCFSDDHSLRKSGLNYIFNNENDYYDDIMQSWFGLTCLKGGWASLRTLEIIAGGAVAIFKDYNKKPIWCDPQDMPCFSYSTNEELHDLMNRLIINNYPTNEYIDMLIKQQNWLSDKMTCHKRAEYLVKTLENHVDRKPYKQEKDFDLFCVSVRPRLYEDVKRSVQPYNLKFFNGKYYPSFAKLINDCTHQCNTDIIIITSDKVSPKACDIEKMLHFLDLGYAFVGFWSFAFFGFRRSLFDKIGPLDERFIGGEFEDSDFYIRLREANLAYFVTKETPYKSIKSSWNNEVSRRFFGIKWGGMSPPWKRLLPEKEYDYVWPKENIKYLDSRYTSSVIPI